VDFAANGKTNWPEYRPDRQVLRIEEHPSVGTDETAPYADI
jgi:hypothetical protein